MNQKNANTLTKGALVGAAVLAGGAAAIALRDKETRKNLGKTLQTIQKKGTVLKNMAQEVLSEKQEELETKVAAIKGK